MVDAERHLAAVAVAARVIYEHIPLALSPATINLLEPAVRKLAEDEWENEQAQRELMNLANEFRSRLQRIARGDLQVSA